jgi:threonine dehydrogenase-like Zn-dependent dehydrogenase
LVDPQGLADLTDDAADVVVEATGSPDGFALARTLLRPMGTLVMKSTYAGGLPDFDMSRLVVDEITVVGSRCGPFGPALRLLEQGLISVKPLIEARYGLEHAVAAIEHAGRKGVLKVLIQP